MCMSCFKTEQSVYHFFDEPTAVESSQESSADMLVQDYIKKSSRHRMKYVKNSFVDYFQNPLTAYDNQEEEQNSFFAIKKVDFNSSLLYWFMKQD